MQPAALVQSPIREPQVGAGELRSSVVYVDTFGNVKLAGLRADLEGALGAVRPGDRPGPVRGGEPQRSGPPGRPPSATSPSGETLVYEDSYGRICLAASQADAAAKHGLVEDLEVIVERANPD